MEYCDFSVNSGYRGEIMCDDGYAKFKVIVSKKDTIISSHKLCKFCLDRFMMDRMKKGLHVDVEEIKGDICQS